MLLIMMTDYKLNKTCEIPSEKVLQPFRRAAEADCILRLKNALIKEKLLDNVPTFTTAHQLLNHVKTQLNPKSKHWEQFLHEIENQITNCTLSLWNNAQRHKTITTLVKKSKCQNLCQWIDEKYSKKDKTLFFEQLVSQGHPYHPCSKTKLGLTLEETVHYSPEFGFKTKIIIGAIDKDSLHIESMHSNLSYFAWFFQAFPELQHKWTYANNYFPIPIHPWQATHELPKQFQQLINTKKLYLSNQLTLPITPTLSFRTVVPTKNNTQPNIKLPVAVQTTSAMRTVSPASSENGPKISKILKSILQKENSFNHTIHVMHERVGLHVKGFKDEDAKHLSAIYRDNPNQYLNDDELGIVVAALFELSPINNQPIFMELMILAGVKNIEDAKKYFQKYTKIVLNSYLDLYLLYGIALEGHQQNTLAVFKQGVPIATIARDFGGLRLHLPSLTANDFELSLYPGSAIVKNDRNEVRNKLIHTTYQYHLGEWVKHLSKFFNVSEKIFWNIVRTVTEERFNQLKHRLNPTTWEQEHKAILEKDWSWKALLRMRLTNVSHDYIYVPFKNPLR